MAKPPEAVDRYRIHADTSLEQMGFVLAALTRMGLDNIGYELITEVATFKKKNGGGNELGSKFIADHPTFEIGEMVKHFVANGFSNTTAYHAAKRFVENKQLRKLDGGGYQRTDVKAIAAPERKPGHGGAPRFEITGYDAVWRHIKKRKGFKVSELAVLFRAQGRKTNSGGPIIAKMAKQKLIKALGGGEYLVVKKAVPKMKTAKKLVKRGNSHDTAIANEGTPYG